MHKFKRLAIAAAAASAFAVPAAHAEGVEFHGYLRTQVGGTSEGGNLQCFGGDGTWPIRSKFRLGNECDSYGEVATVLPFGKQDGAWAKWNLMLALKEKNARDAEHSSANAGGGSDGFDIMSRQNFVQAGGFFPRGALEDAKIWIGKRYYNRHDIHITDYFYWQNSGPGAGLEDINAGPVKLAFAYLQSNENSTGGLQNPGNGHPFGDVTTKKYSMRVYDLDVNPNGKLEGELVYIQGSSADPAAQEAKGYALMIEHTQNGLLGGFNKLALVYGSKAGTGFEWIPTYAGGGGDPKGNTWRLHEQLYFDLKNGFSGMFTTSYGRANFGGPNDNTWFNIGIRPQYNFTANYSVAVEAGLDQGKTDSGSKPKIAKLTVAPQITLSGGFWARPAFRAFATYAKWNDDAGNAGTNGVFGTKKHGMSYGVQVETWW